MGDDLEPVARGEVVTQPAPHRRILMLMAAVGVVGSIAGAVYHSAGFAAGILLGTALAFVNYFWLKRSLKKIFASAAEGRRPRMLAAAYLLRYLVMAAIIAVVYGSKVVPIAALIIGFAGFGFAVVLEGFIRIFLSIFSEKEIQ